MDGVSSIRDTHTALSSTEAICHSELDEATGFAIGCNEKLLVKKKPDGHDHAQYIILTHGRSNNTNDMENGIFEVRREPLA